MIKAVCEDVIKIGDLEIPVAILNNDKVVIRLDYVLNDVKSIPYISLSGENAEGYMTNVIPRLIESYMRDKNAQREPRELTDFDEKIQRALNYNPKDRE